MEWEGQGVKWEEQGERGLCRQNMFHYSPVTK